MCVLSSAKGTARMFLAPLTPGGIYLLPFHTEHSFKFLIVGTNCELEKHPKLTASQKVRSSELRVPNITPPNIGISEIAVQL